MSQAPAENPSDAFEKPRSSAAESAPANPEALKRQEDAEMNTRLESLANEVQQKKESQEVQKQTEAPLEELAIDAGLEALEQRKAKVEKVLSKPKTNADRLHDDMESAQEVVTGTISTGYGYVKEKVLKPLVEYTKDWFLVGPLIGSLSELTSEQVTNALSRKWNEFLSTVETFVPSDPTGFFGKKLSGIAEGAKQKLAFLDMRDIIEGYKAEKKPGETITLDETLTAEEWKKMKEALAKDPVAMTAKVINLINKRREAGILTINITSADLTNTAEENEEASKKEKVAKQKNAVLNGNDWKNAGVTEVAFSSTETSLEGGKLSINEGDLDESGAPKPNTQASALLEARQEISTDKIIIARDPKDLVVLNWNMPKTVTLPMNTATSKARVNELIHAPQPDRFSVLEIGPNDNIAPDEVQLKPGDNGNVLIAENNPAVLDAIARGNPKIDSQEKSPKYKYTNGDFTDISSTMPTQA